MKTQALYKDGRFIQQAIDFAGIRYYL